ncbi:MAG TPA: nuclear transport factor 2 family protein [Methylocystis sp.]|jgi:ketosteroid isomerase-like protein
MAGDTPAVLSYFVEDVEISYNGSAVGYFPQGHWRGRDALRENLRRTDIEYEPLDAEVRALLVEADRTVVHFIGRWRHRATSSVYNMDMAYFLRWRKGKIARMHEFIDHHAASRAADPPASFEELLRVPTPGLSRDEMASRVASLGSFACRGPDIELFRKYCAPQVVSEFVGDRSKIFYAGRHHGIDALASIIRAIGMEFEQVGATTPETIVDGCWLAVRRTVEWRHWGTGRRGVVELADFARFADGLIVELIEFRDNVALMHMQD